MLCISSLRRQERHMVSHAAQTVLGVSEQFFPVLYLVVAVVMAMVATVHCRILFAGDPGVPAERLAPQQVAFLTAGPRLAVYSALGGLRAHGAIGTGPRHGLTQTGPLPPGATALDVAVYNAAGTRVRGKSLHIYPTVRRAVDHLREELEATGLAVTERQSRAVRSWEFAGMAYLAVGILTAGMGRDDIPGIGYLLGSVVAAMALFWLLTSRAPDQTRAAHRVLADLRDRYHHLNPTNKPSYRLYGAAAAAMGIAVYGVSAFYTMDPAFAAEAQVQRVTPNGSGNTSYDSTSSSSCGSAGSCGSGGGCGGGCGG
jgi:uncharacterized protein (TIGR04222 family)